jgi:hypothetical protein
MLRTITQLMNGSFLHKLFVFANFFTTENIKNVLYIPQTLGEICHISLKKIQKTLHHISTWILVWGPFLKANIHFFSKFQKLITIQYLILFGLLAIHATLEN